MTKRDVELLFEVGTLRHVARTWRQFGGANFANVAEHSMRVSWLAMVIAHGEGADVGKCVRMALLHDLAETRTGDSNYVSRLYTARNERDAFMHSVVGTTIEHPLRDLWEEYEAKQTLEAKVVKDADNLDCDLELAELASTGSKLPSLLERTRAAVFERLFTDTARAIYHQVRSSDPHSWHDSGVNRLTAGDWRGTPDVQLLLPTSAKESEEDE